jgi:hypothetical protein
MLVSNMRRSRATLMSCTRCGWSTTPALLTSPSSGPSSASMRREHRQHLRLVGHVGGHGDGPPAARAHVGRHAVGGRGVARVVHRHVPAGAGARRQQAAPMPRDAPVTRTVRPGVSEVLMPMILGAATLGRNDGAGDARSVTKAAQNPRDTTRGDTMPTKDFDSMEDSNRSSNPSIHDLSDPARRTVLRGSLGLAAAALYGPLVAGCAGAAPARDPGRPVGPLHRLQGHTAGMGDKLVVPEGYSRHRVIAAWGEPIGMSGNMPAFKPDASTAPPSRRCRWACTTTASTSSRWTAAQRGLLVMNHEYTDDGLLHPDGMKTGRREGAQGAGRARRVGDRGGTEGRPLADGAALAYARRITAARRSRWAARPPATP